MGFPVMVGLVAVAWMLIVLTGAGEQVVAILAAADEPHGIGAAVAALTAPGVLLAAFLPSVPLLAGVAGTELGGVGTWTKNRRAGPSAATPFWPCGP